MDIPAAVLVVLLVQAAIVVIWGARLTQRVKALEADIAPLKDEFHKLVVQVTRLDVKQDGIIEQLRDMNASLRWLREPASYMPSDLKRPGG